MKRREFIGLVGGAAIALPLGARAQEPGRIYRLAVVISSGRDEPPTAAFLDELREQGFVEGKNLEFIPGGFRFDNQQTAAVVPAIVKAAPDAIVVAGDFIAEKFQKETKSIPLVVMTEDMIAAGFAASLAKPGGNITGISLMSPDLDGKRQDILIEAVPGAQRIAVLADSNVATLQHLRALEATARSAHGKELLVVRAANSSEIMRAMNDANAQGAERLTFCPRRCSTSIASLSLSGLLSCGCLLFINGPKRRTRAGCWPTGPASSRFFVNAQGWWPKFCAA